MSRKKGRRVPFLTRVVWLKGKIESRISELLNCFYQILTFTAANSAESHEVVFSAWVINVCVWFFCTVGCTGLVSVWKMCVRPRVQDESSTTVIVFQEGTDSKVPLRKPTKRLSWHIWVWYCTEEMESETDVIKQNIQKSILTLSELGDVCILLTLTNMTNRGESRAIDWFVCSGLP